MKIFQQLSCIQKFECAEEFLEEYQIGEKDFILASKVIYEKYFLMYHVKAHVVFKSQYGTGEPTDKMLDALIQDFRKTDCERIIAIGGGAVIDMAKLLVLDGEYGACDIFQKKVPLKKVRTLIAVPTTCGAGSEVSNVTITEITDMHSKLGLAADELYADVAVLIPELLMELPYTVWATSAIDAFIHAIESYVSPRANLYTELFSMKAMEMIMKGFQQVTDKGEEMRITLMEQFLIASNLAGIAFGNAGTGAVHALSYPLSGVYHVAHGESNYQFLTAVFSRYLIEKPNGKLKVLNQFLGDILGCEPDAVYQCIEKLFDQIISRKRLSEYGMEHKEIIAFAESVKTSQQRLLKQSYVNFTTEQIAEIYRSLY